MVVVCIAGLEKGNGNRAVIRRIMRRTMHVE